MKCKGVILGCMLFFGVSCSSVDPMEIDQTDFGELTRADPEQLTADSIQLTYNARTNDNSVMFFKPRLQPRNLGLYGWMDDDSKYIKEFAKESYYVVKYSRYNRHALKMMNDIISFASFNHVKCMLYGKDRFGRNVGYIYEVGRRDQGLVFFYPDNWDCVNYGWEKEKSNCYGLSIRIDNFITLMLKTNPHIYMIK